MWRQNLKRGCIIASLGRALRDSPVLAAAALGFFSGFRFGDGFFLRLRSALRLGYGLVRFCFHMQWFAIDRSRALDCVFMVDLVQRNCLQQL